MRKTKKYSQKIFLILILATVFTVGFWISAGVSLAVSTPKCSDGVDNDGDGEIDFGIGPNNDSDCISNFDQSEGSGHPFLLVTEDMYGDMRARASQSPWKEMKAEAIKNCKNLNHESDYNTAPLSSSVHVYYSKGAPLQRRMNGCALAYILDPGNKATYLAQYKQMMSNWPDLREIANIICDPNKPEITNCTRSNDGDQRIIIGSAYIMSAIATDIFYNELTQAEINTYDNQYFTRTFVEGQSKKNHNRGAKLIWAIYNKNTALAHEYNQLYLDTFFKDRAGNTGGAESVYVSNDGAYGAGSYYAFERNIARGHRVSKFGEMDIATFSGYHNFFGDERFEKLYQWNFHFAATPSRRNYLTSFGDTQLTENWASFLPKAARLYTLNKWSADLAGHTAWLIEGSGDTTWGESSLFAYVNDKSLPAPIKPASRIFNNGGAAFWENNSSDNSLMGAIQSMDISEWHTRNEANSIYIYGYGEHLITNPGSVSYGDPCFTPDGVGHDMTNSKFNSNVANTVAINWTKHGKKSGYNYERPDAGKGISEGFVNNFFDYASADSGAALPNGHHQRNFIFIHPEGGKNNGYYILFDEIAAVDNPLNTSAQVYLHTVSDSLVSVDEGKEYKARTQLPDLVTSNNTDASISIFLGTPPSANLGAQIKENDGNGVVYVGKPSASNPAAYCRYVDFLRTNYDLNVAGSSRKKNIVTILFPSDDNHTKPLMTRITGTSFTGAEISHSSTIKDCAIESSSDNSINHNGVSFKGLVSMYRINNNENEFYFVRQGKEFNDGKTNKKGFTSNNPVTVYIKDKTGKIIVPTGGATVTFSYPGITGIKVDGVTKPVNTNILAGNHDIEILTGVVLSPADVNNDSFVNILDVQLCVNVILGMETDPAIVARAKAVAEPLDSCSVLDLQMIVNEILK